MKIKVYKDRSVFKENRGKAGTVNENRYETLEFEFCEEIKDYQKYIEFETEDGKFVDTIENDIYILKNNITKYPIVKTQIVAKKTNEEETIDFRSHIFTLCFENSINAGEQIAEENKDIIAQLQEKMENIQEKGYDDTELREQIKSNSNEITTMKSNVLTNLELEKILV